MAEKVEFEKGIGKRGDYILWRDGYRYVRNKTVRNEFGTTIYWQCEVKCGVTVKTVNNEM